MKIEDLEIQIQERFGYRFRHNACVQVLAFLVHQGMEKDINIVKGQTVSKIAEHIGIYRDGVGHALRELHCFGLILKVPTEGTNQYHVYVRAVLGRARRYDWDAYREGVITENIRHTKPHLKAKKETMLRKGSIPIWETDESHHRDGRGI